MSNNRTFFKNIKEGHMSLKDIFSDVLKKHTPEESARVLIAGTPLTTPKESEMLSGWQKPYLFARFFALCAVVMALAYFLVSQDYPGHDILLVALTLVLPVTMLILTWEMNIPRDISLMEVVKLVAVGGMLSLIITVIFNVIKYTFVLISENYSLTDAVWAPLVEEPAKLAVIYLVLKRKNRKYILDGVLIGMAVGTGFAMMETLGYVMNSMREGMILSLVAMMAGDLEANSASAVLSHYIDLVRDSSSLSSLSYTVFMLKGNGGFQLAMKTAIHRGLGSIASHGTYAALYGGGLMIAKGAHPVQFKHLLHLDHLKYFLVACLLHAANNSIVSAYIRVAIQWEINDVLNNEYLNWPLVESVLIMLFFLPLLRKGVNQIVDISAAHNGGRVTMAVNRNAPTLDASTVYLEFVSGPAAGRTFSVSEGQRLTLGRGAGCDVSLPGAANVSGTHCAVRMSGGSLTVTDLGSTNGTFVANRRLNANQSVPLADGAVVYLGSQDCAFRVRLR